MLQTKVLQVEWDPHSRTFNAPGGDVPHKILQFATSLITAISTQSKEEIKNLVGPSSCWNRQKSVFVNLFYREFMPLGFGFIGSFIQMDKKNVQKRIMEHQAKMLKKADFQGFCYRNLYNNSCIEIKISPVVLSDNEKESFYQLFKDKPTKSEVVVEPEIGTLPITSLFEIEDFVWKRIKHINSQSHKSGIRDDNSYIHPEFKTIFAQILFNVSSKAQVPVHEIFHKEKKGEVIMLRQIAMVEFFETIKNISEKQIVKFFGKNLRTLAYSQQIVRQLKVQKNPDYLRLKVNRIPPLSVSFSLNSHPLVPADDELWNKVWKDILNAVCVGLGVTSEQLNQKGRSWDVVDGRRMVYWFVYKTEMLHHKNFSLEQIGELLTGQDHATVLHHRSALRNFMETKQKDFYEKFVKVFELLKGKFPKEIEEEIWNFKVEEKESEK